MLSPQDFRAIVSGQRRDIGALLWRTLLRTASIPYSIAMRFRNWRYDNNPKRVTRVSVPVISIGNLTLGGTGKSPLVEWVASWYRKRNVRVAILSRGYNSADGAANDEALELEEKLPDVPHIQNPNRIAAAQIAIDELDMQLLILDDAMQHRRIARDLEITVIDALEPSGLGYVFPRGTLREPISGATRADVLVLTRAALVSADERLRIRGIYSKIAPHTAWVEASHEPVALRSANGDEQSCDQLRGKNVAAFCGIGNPTGFRGTVESCGATIVEFQEFSDHHLYSRDDIEKLNAWASKFAVDAILCTHKDLVKIGLDSLGNKSLYAVRIGIKILTGEAELVARLQKAMPADRDQLS